MPYIDVTDLMSDPDFCESVTLRRTSQTVDSNGFTTLVEVDSTITVIVTPLNPDFMRSPEFQNAKSAITVHTQTPLFAVVAGYNPDIIVWKGSNYVVKRASDLSHFGRGFTSASCILLDTALAS